LPRWLLASLASAARMPSARMRAMMSDGPPAPNATTIVTGRVG
jgi:hypothetical protein